LDIKKIKRGLTNLNPCGIINVSNERNVNKMTKVSYLVIYPDKTRKIVRTLAEALAVKQMGGTYKTVYSKIYSD
jgi:hypothetical protein